MPYFTFYSYFSVTTLSLSSVLIVVDVRSQGWSWTPPPQPQFPVLWQVRAEPRSRQENRRQQGAEARRCNGHGQFIFPTFVAAVKLPFMLEVANTHILLGRMQNKEHLFYVLSCAVTFTQLQFRGKDCTFLLLIFTYCERGILGLMQGQWQRNYSLIRLRGNRCIKHFVLVLVVNSC